MIWEVWGDIWNGASDIILNLTAHAIELTNEAAVMAAKKGYFSAVIASVSSCSPQLFKVVQHLLMPKAEPLMFQQQTISCDTFAKFFADKISRTGSALDVSCNRGIPEERLFMDHFNPVSLMDMDKIPGI